MTVDRSYTVVFKLFAVTLVLFGCKRDPEVEPVNFGYNYLPLEVGHWIEYDVDSVVYDDFNDTITKYEYIVRETVADTFRDATGALSYRILRERQSQDTAAYTTIEAYALTPQVRRIERLHQNRRIVVLSFPVQEGRRWDGNAFNNAGTATFEYDYADVQESWSGVSFDSVARVVQENDTDNLVIRRFAEERFARGTGMIYREFLHIESNFETDSGLHYIQQFRASGP